MVSGLSGQDEQVTVRQLAANKSLSSISIPTSYQYYYQSGEGTGGYFPVGSSSVGAASGGQEYTRDTLPQPGRERRPIGPGYYQRTLSSSSLLTNKSSAVAKSRSDYCAVGRTSFIGTTGGGDGRNAGSSCRFDGRSPINYHNPISSSSSNIVYVDNNEYVGGCGGGSSSGSGNAGGGRDYRGERRLIRESSQPIIIHVPITAPKATATTLSRATSPPPPQFSTSLTSSPKKSLSSSSSRAPSSQHQQQKGKRSNRQYDAEVQQQQASKKSYENSLEMEDSTTTDTETGQEDGDNFASKKRGRSILQETKVEIEVPHEQKILLDVKPKVIPSSLTKYCQNAPLKKVKHPLEENIFSSLVITLVAVGVALVIGIPVLFLTGALLLLAITVRYSLFLLHGCYSYLHFICSNRRRLSTRANPPQIFPHDRLAFANDVRWLGKRKPKQCKCIIQTLLVFDGSLDLASLRHLVQSRVLHAETPEGELAYPRLMQKVIGFPAGYKWELDVTFDIQNHIFLGPSYVRNESQIQKYLGLLLMENLPLTKPLWEIRVFTNYGAQKDTVAILRVHQCLADGMTLVRILSHSLADQAQMHIPQRPHFAGLSFGFNVIRSMIVGPLTFFMWLLTSFRDHNLFSIPLGGSKNFWFKTTSRFRNRQTCFNNSDSGNDTSISPSEKEKGKQLGSSSSADETSPSPARLTTTSSRRHASQQQQQHQDEESQKEDDPPPDDETKSPIMSKKLKVPRKVVVSGKRGGNKSKGGEGSLGFKRRRRSTWNVIWSAPLSIPKVARVKQIMRSSLNDVLLSATSGSVRLYLQKMGIPFPDDLKVVIPIDLRNDISSPKSSAHLGCKVATVLAKMPCGIEGAIPRLWATRHRLDELKASADPVVAYGATTVLMNVLPERFAISLLDSITDKASLQFCNSPGPTHTLVVGGFPLKGIYPIYPPCGKIRVAISVFSYADQIHLTVVSHRSLTNAGPSLLQGITSQMDQLSRQLSARRVPGESRRSTRNQSMNNPEICKPPTRQIHMQLQVVQEELQQLSHRLDSRAQDVEMPSSVGQPPVPGLGEGHNEEGFRSSEESLGGGASSSISPAGQAQLRTRLKTLKNEFSELMGELRRRSSIVEGVVMSFEDEESEDDFRKPRKRALSVVSMSRRNSLFASRSITTPESSVCYSSDDDLPSSPSHDSRMYPPPSNIRQSSSPIRTTAV